MGLTSPTNRKTTNFQKVKVGRKFRYDNEDFEKTTDRTAWSLRSGQRYKEWAFTSEEQVEIKVK